MATQSKLLVIDASVARAAGDSIGISQQCRHFLENVKSICHRFAADKVLLQEWKNHKSRFSKKWLVSMYARKKVVEVTSDDLIFLSRSSVSSSKKTKTIQKDAHLIKIALKTDKIVVSLDNAARSAFCDLGEKMVFLKNVMWVNPNERDILDWLKEGAKQEDRRCL